MTIGSSFISFPDLTSLGHRDWGTEDLYVYADGYFTFKRLFIKAGCQGGLQYHHKKEEVGFLLSGVLLVRYESPTGELLEKELLPGSCFHFPPGSVHQEEGITDVLILEVSSPYFNDRVRVESYFGLPDLGGLSSTSVTEITSKPPNFTC